jgi:hypothetical protein
MSKSYRYDPYEDGFEKSKKVRNKKIKQNKQNERRLREIDIDKEEPEATSFNV